jgi:hypothetical protein
MSRWTRLASKLYPRAWRDRYQREFAALLDDADRGWRDTLNVLQGALTMQLLKGIGFGKLALALGAMGALIAIGVSFSSRMYLSAATVRLTPSPGAPANDAGAAGLQLQILPELLSRGRLAELIQRLDLYPNERQRYPLEEVIQQMRASIRVQVAPRQSAFTVSFQYPDRAKARQVASELSARVVQAIEAAGRHRREIYTTVWREEAPAGFTASVTGAQETRALAGKWLWFAFGGMSLGILAAAFLRRTRQALVVAGCAAAGCILALCLSLLVRQQFVSEVVLRLAPPVAPERVIQAAYPTPPADRFRKLAEQVMSPENLARMIPTLRLYRDLDLPAAIDRMRKDVSFRVLDGTGLPTVAVAFKYPDATKAQAAVRQITTRLMEQYISERQQSAKAWSPEILRMEEYRVGENLEVLDPASWSNQPIFPNRWIIAYLGIAGGMALGLALLARRRALPRIAL